MTDRIPQQLRPFLILAPGAILVAAFYGLDYSNPDVVYPAHGWSTAGAVLGWWLLLVALVLLGRTQITSWLALFSAIAIGNASVTAFSASSWVGFFGACLVVMLAASTALVDAYGWRGRVIGSIVLFSIGVAVIVLSSFFPRHPIWDSPPGLLMTSLVASPVAIGTRWAWRWRYGPLDQSWLAGCPWWGFVWLISFLWAIYIPVQLLRQFGAPNIVAWGGGVAVVIIVGAVALSVAPSVQSWSQHWLPTTSPPVGRKRQIHPR